MAARMQRAKFSPHSIQEAEGWGEEGVKDKIDPSKACTPLLIVHSTFSSSMG
jgi:hypothetical protein